MLRRVSHTTDLRQTNYLGKRNALEEVKITQDTQHESM
jgi:hypothetical protein